VKKKQQTYYNRERYFYDFKRCRGWAQLDTNADAWYYGTWACPDKLQLIDFVEGDETITTCESVQEWVQVVKDWFKWAVGLEYNPSIDPWGGSGGQVEKWEKLGLTTELLRKEYGEGEGGAS